MSIQFPLTALSAFVLALPVCALETPLEKATKAFQEGEYALVLEQTKTVEKSSPDWPRTQYLAGETQLILGDPYEAEVAFRNVLTVRPKAIPAQVGLGRALTLVGKTEEAEEVLSAAIAAEPKDVGAKTAKAELLAATAKPDEARKEYVAALQLDPKSPLTARSYFEFLLHADDLPEAKKVGEGFAKVRPDHPLGFFLAGVALERDGKDKEAIEQYQKALEKDANYIDAHKNLAILCHTLSNTYQDKERVKLAYEHYERYFALGGKDEELRKAYDGLLQYKKQIVGE